MLLLRRGEGLARPVLPSTRPSTCVVLVHTRSWSVVTAIGGAIHVPSAPTNVCMQRPLSCPIKRTRPRMPYTTKKKITMINTLAIDGAVVMSVSTNTRMPWCGRKGGVCVEKGAA